MGRPLEDLVNGSCQAGYEPQGSPFAMTTHSGVDWYQAMVRREKRELDTDPFDGADDTDKNGY